ncbi:MAG: glycosyltransferase family 9 protein [Saprospiraceae bacterium]|nr:glycosyltransferase family 9 protein [Saprospiraceae bacterium]MCF8251426.1 glycosyltransferase family 9 protein [Saprospiraceae bacterium]MCF8312700.1 glycosyltransferase family 9 protein [Saprospiraceae bacterium]MCF8441034.1 glycosyltransferase family 9 protein [Saprospiraceae bacterium]
MKSTKKAVIVFNAGLGDGLQMTPLWRSLREQGYQLTLMTVSPYFPGVFAQSLNLVDEIVEIRQKKQLVFFVLKNLFHFDYAFLDYYSSGPLWSLIACLISKKAVTNRNKWYLKLLPNLKYRQPLPATHNMLQNLHIAGIEIPKLFELSYKLSSAFFTTHHVEVIEMAKKKGFVVAQICAANKQVDYKNWQPENWDWLLNKIYIAYPSLFILLIGDENEATEVQLIAEKSGRNVISLAGKTSLSDLGLLISKAKMYLGLDSGPMHLAAMLGIPTFTFWGPSDPQTIGYEVIAPHFHKVVCLNIECHPCLSFICPNTSLVNHPSKCPFPRCIKEIKKEEVWLAFQSHWNKIYSSGLSK